MNEEEFPEIEKYRDAVLENIYQTALNHEERGEMNKLFPFFQFASGPDSIVTQNAPDGLVDRFLDRLEDAQREDGGWEDEHGLAYWQPYFFYSYPFGLQTIWENLTDAIWLGE